MTSRPTAGRMRADLYRVDTRDDVDDPQEWEWRWRLWSGSRIVGGSTESYSQRPGAIANLETVLGGGFEKVSTRDFPVPFGQLRRWVTPTVEQVIPVRLVVAA